MRAIIIGGEIGGLAAAVALRQVGIEAVVYERATELREVGAGLILWPNALRALEMLGLAEAVRAVSLAAGGSALLTKEGVRLLGGPTGAALERDFRTPAAAVHRAELLGVLLQALGEGVVHLGARCTGCRQEKEGVTALFDDGAAARGDLLVGADGLRSAVRAQMFGTGGLRYAGYTAWRGVAAFALDGGEWFESWGRGERFGAGPLTRGRAYWYATANTPEGSADAPMGRRRELLERFRGWHAPVAALVEATAEAGILRNDIYDRDPLPRWSAGAVTLLGDAAHPTTPNIGQGACQALEDAVVLARCLRESADLAAAFRAYEARRRARTRAITLFSRRIGRVAQWEHPVACLLRDRLMARTPAYVRRRQMERWFRFEA
jgi:2-polyprenyl-6-methoxyphenol hydroxylase-like FAD-dependent oxidoreductase